MKKNWYEICVDEYTDWEQDQHFVMGVYATKGEAERALNKINVKEGEYIEGEDGPDLVVVYIREVKFVRQVIQAESIKDSVRGRKFMPF